MRTEIAQPLRARADIAQAEAEIRKCVHCGFCNVTCPTYRIARDERDGPRGRLYMIKTTLETNRVSATLQTHLDRCLTCRACETTCPAGVQYGRVLDVGREAARQVPRPAGARLRRWLALAVLTRPRRFRAALAAGRLVRPLLPRRLRAMLPRHRPPGPERTEQLRRRMLLLAGCVQDALDPPTNAAARRVLARFGIALDARPGAGCCGAMAWHLAEPEQARAQARANIDAWWPAIEQGGVEAIVASASGCGVMLKDYGHVLRDDPAYAQKAARVSALAHDLAEVVAGENLADVPRASLHTRRVAFQCPCTLQHGERLGGTVEGILRRLGFDLAPVADPEQCCGAAGTYTLFNPAWADQLGDRKLEALTRGTPELIATANIGCQVHLQARTALPVRHWIELLDPRIDPLRTAGGSRSPDL